MYFGNNRVYDARNASILEPYTHADTVVRAFLDALNSQAVTSYPERELKIAKYNAAVKVKTV